MDDASSSLSLADFSFSSFVFLGGADSEAFSVLVPATRGLLLFVGAVVAELLFLEADCEPLVDLNGESILLSSYSRCGLDGSPCDVGR